MANHGTEQTDLTWHRHLPFECSEVAQKGRKATWTVC